MNNAFVCPRHPLFDEWMATLRQRETPVHEFRRTMAEIGRYLAWEATRDWLPQVMETIETPVETTQCARISHQRNLVLVPVLRAGLALYEGMSTLAPWSKVCHVGVKRNEKTLEPSLYLNMLPTNIGPDRHILVVDPMLATGGSLCLVLREILRHGVAQSNIRLVVALAAPEGVKRIHSEFPEVKIFAAALDRELNSHGYIAPGLGDAGDRSFGTFGELE